MIIYKIANNVNKKCYIGQSINPFKRRYVSGKWWDWTSNDHLYNAARKYGLVNFTVEFLEENVESQEKLNELEIFYIKKFDCIHPNGYNYQPGGGGKGSRVHCQKSRDKIALSRTNGKIYKIRNQKTGEIFEFFNIEDFCKKNNIANPPLLHHVLYGRRKRTEFWTLPETILKKWKLKSPEGIEYLLFEGEMKKFCREHGLGPAYIFQLASKKRDHYNGWQAEEFY